MKSLVIFLSLILSSTAFAEAITCKVSNESESKLVIEFDQNKLGVSKIDYFQAANAQTIFSRWPQIRGEFSADYCNPNDNQYRKYSDSYFIFASCNAVYNPIYFQADFSIKNGGKLSYLKKDFSEKEIVFTECTQGQTVQNPTIVQRPEIKVIGASVRTNNKDEMSGRGKIGLQWQTFFKEQIQNKIPNKVNENVLALYTDYESDVNGEYSFILGSEVRTFDVVPDGMMAKLIPSAKYAVFTSRRGPIPDIIFEIWKRIWELKPNETTGNRAYLADFEVYDSRSKDPKNAQVDIYLSIK